MEQRNIISIFAEHSEELITAMADVAKTLPEAQQEAAQSAINALQKNLKTLAEFNVSTQEKMQIALSALFMNDQGLPNTVTKRESSATNPLPALQHTDLPKLEQAEKSAIEAFYDVYGRAVATLVATHHPELAKHYDQQARVAMLLNQTNQK